MRSILKLLLTILIFSQLGCEKNKNIVSEKEFDTNSVTLQISSNNIPQDIKYLVLTMSRTGFDSEVKEFNVSNNDSAVIRFDNLAIGLWHLKVDAFDIQNILKYTGECDVDVLHDRLTKVYLTLNPVGGNVEIHVTWGHEGPQTFIFDFESGDLSGWAGTADAEIVDGTLHEWSVYGYKWHSISNTGQHFSKGTIEFDIKPGDGDYAFETKGATAETFQQNWGIFMRWRERTIQVHKFIDSKRVLVDTGVSYEPNVWYHIRIQFNNKLGEKGRFSVWSKPREEGDEVFVGEFEYLAEYGKLIGVSVVSTIVTDLNKQILQHVYYDNIQFHVIPS